MSTVSSDVTGDLTGPSNSLCRLDSESLWRSPTPAGVVKAWRGDDPQAAWRAWADHLGQADAPGPLEGLMLSKKGHAFAPLLWGCTAEADSFGRWLDDLAGPLQSDAPTHGLEAAAAEWTAEGAERPPSVRFALEAIAWAYALRGLAPRVEPAVWWGLCDRLLALHAEASGPTPPEGDRPAEALIEQLLAGELPLALGALLPELRPFYDLRSDACDALGQGLLRLTDGEGLPGGSFLAPAGGDAMAQLFACWTRCRAVGKKRKRGPWSSDAELQYEWLVRQSLRLVDRLGRFPFVKEGPDNLALFDAAIRLAGDAADQAAASLRLKGAPKGDDSIEPPQAANHSEWSGLGVLAAGWRDKAPRIVVTHPADTMGVEVCSGRGVLFSGVWPIGASRDGRALRPTGEWETQCWHSDEDGDYLELAIDLEGMRLERQFFLSREDGVAMLGELLLAGERGEPARLSIESRLPLGAGARFAPEKETREGALVKEGESLAGVVPLALPEWRDDPRGGELSADGETLRLTREAEGRNLASPLWIDFSPKRFAKQRTWRQLTVAQSLEVVPHDVAVGYRVQAGKAQWVAYRSLDKPANRTLLGHNLSSECLVGRFLSTGEVDEYFEIKADDA